MFSMLKAYWPMLAVKNDKSTDLRKAGEAATIIGDAMVRSMQLFPVGTGKGEVEGTWSRAKPAIWSQYKEFEAAAEELVSASRQIATTAVSGEIDEFKAQFGRMERACIGCHDFKPTSGGRFRFAK